MIGASASQLPLVVVPHGSSSVRTFELLESAAGTCRILWLIDAEERSDCPLVRFLSRRGNLVHAPAKASAEQLAELLAPFEPDGIVAYRDRDLEQVALVGAALGLPAHSPEAARRLMDKRAQREALAAIGLPVPRALAVTAAEDAGLPERVEAEVGFPVVVKPRRGDGSTHVFRAADRTELAAVLQRWARSDMAGCPFLVEEYLDDLPEVSEAGFASVLSVETVVAGGTTRHLATNGRLPFAEPFRETGTFIPSPLPKAQYDLVLDVATSAVQSMGEVSGFIHTEIKLTPAGPRVVEVNGRMGGGVPEMMRLASGVDLFTLSMRAAVGLPIEFTGMIACDAVGFRYMHPPPATARRVTVLEGLDHIGKFGGVSRVAVRHEPGARLDSIDGTKSFVFEVTGAVEDHGAMLELVELIKGTAAVGYESLAS